MLGPSATQALGLAFHELATNAAKHGALAQPGGSIEITWDVETKGNTEIFQLAWREWSQSSDPVEPNKKSGFGCTVLTRVVPDALSGEVQYQLGAEGISWKIEAPLHEVVPPSASALCPANPSFTTTSSSVV